MPPVTNCASYIDIEAQFVTVKGIEEGCFGTCTDENGNYTLEGLPCETYNIVAGRDFCKQHPYAEQTAFGITIDSMTPGVDGVDFPLELAPPDITIADIQR